MNNIRQLSIIIPVYNEEKVISKIINKVLEVDLAGIQKEIIIVDDGSTDSTVKKLKKSIRNKKNVSLLLHRFNRGKSSAIRTGLKSVKGDVTVIQDGDQEYDPKDFKKMLDQMQLSNVRVVYGSRNLSGKNKKYSGFSFYIGGKILTYLTNLLYGSHITDEPTCYKMFDTKLLKSFKLNSKRFEFCPEVTAKALKRGIDIKEVPIYYHPRHVNQGKKIKLRDFFEAVFVLFKERVSP